MSEDVGMSGFMQVLLADEKLGYRMPLRDEDQSYRDSTVFHPRNTFYESRNAHLLFAGLVPNLRLPLSDHRTPGAR